MPFDYADAALEVLRTGVNFVKSCLSLPVITPALIGSIVSKYEKDLSEHKKQHMQPMVTRNDLQQILKAEEEKKQLYLRDILVVQRGLEAALESRCENCAPSKRKEWEDYVLKNSPWRIRRDLKNIFQYDHTRCDSNHQLIQAWVTAWAAEAEARKYKNVVQQLKEKIKE